MPKMHAAVIERWGESPKYQHFKLAPPKPSQVRIRVIAARVHEDAFERVHRRPAHAPLPYIPGRDGVGVIVGSEELVYFTGHHSPTGPLAEEINVEKMDVFPLPRGADPDATALQVGVVAGPWMAITCRAGIKPWTEFAIGVIGANFKGGHASIRTAKAMGATTIVGMDDWYLESCARVGATSTIDMGNKCKIAEEVDFTPAADVDVVIDYGHDRRSSIVLREIVKKRRDKRRRLTWVKMDSLTSDNFLVPILSLRLANLYVCGSTPMTWSYSDLSRELPEILETITREGMQEEEPHSVQRLADVESWWNHGEVILAKP